LGFVSDCNRDSLHKVEAYADGYFEGSDVFSAFQFERVGFFSIDPDTNEDRVSTFF
jgi:glutaminyl-tRNA synthetase